MLARIVPDLRSADSGRELQVALLAGALLFGLSLLALALAQGLEGGFARLLQDPRAYLVAIGHEVATDRIANAAEVVAGVLAILITVVAIVVELAANRYTHRITQLFVREPLNVAVMALFVLTAILCLWLSATPPPPPEAVPALPRAGLVLAMALVTLCLLVLVPYFAFLFRFVSPLQVIDRIRRQAELGVARGRGGRVEAGRALVIEATEELEDVSRGARVHSDRVIAMAAVDALAGFLARYAREREGLPPAWFAISEHLAHDADFVAMAPMVLEELEDKGSWLEAKILRQYLALFSESLNEARDIANLITLNTRQLGERDQLPFGLATQFFNSYLRMAINARDLRTAYYVLHQYRLLAEHCLDRGDGASALDVADHLRYYGLLGYDAGQAFLLEVVAYDVALLVEGAAVRRSEAVDPLLGLLLTVDAPPRREDQVAPARGVRRAQIQLATFFLDRGDEARARRILGDLVHDPPETLAAIRREIEDEIHAHYREFTDRGVNFAYLPPRRRVHLERLYGWLEQETGSADALTPT